MNDNQTQAVALQLAEKLEQLAAEAREEYEGLNFMSSDDERENGENQHPLMLEAKRKVQAYEEAAKLLRSLA